MSTRVNYVHLTASSPLPDISGLRPFKAIVIVADAIVPDRRAAISEWLVASGCLYMMAWGIECSAWEDAVELANFKAFDFAEIPDDRLVITTWHDNQALTEVFWFAKHTAMHPCCRLGNVLLLHLSPTGREQELTDEYDAA